MKCGPQNLFLEQKEDVREMWIYPNKACSLAKINAFVKTIGFDIGAIVI